MHRKICRSGPQRGKALEIEFLSEFESVFETALDHESEDQLGTFDKITLDKKSHATVPLSRFQCSSKPPAKTKVFI